jgi:hypothetical protein
MGRWAQQRRRGSSVPEPAPEPPAALHLVSVQRLDETTVQYAFDGEITVDDSITADGITVDGSQPVHVFSTGPTTATGQYFIEIIAGQPFECLAQPVWLLESLTVPVSGVVSGV